MVHMTDAPTSTCLVLQQDLLKMEGVGNNLIGIVHVGMSCV